MRHLFLLLLFIFVGCAHKKETRALNEQGLLQWQIGQYRQHVIVKRSELKTAPVLVFVHGGPGNPLSPYAHKLDPYFLKQFNVVHWDQRGAGLSFTETKGTELKVTRYIEDLSELIKKVKSCFPKQKIVLVAASWGSLFGIRFANQHPELVDLYIGVGQMIRPLMALKQGYGQNSKNSKVLEKLGAPPWKLYQFFKFVRAMDRLHSYPAKIGFTEMNKIANSSPYYSNGTSVIENGQVLSIEKLLPEIYAFDSYQAVPTLKIPHLFLQGEYDWITPTNLVADFVKERKGPVHLKEIKGHGHNLIMENPELVSKAIENFVNLKLLHTKEFN